MPNAHRERPKNDRHQENQGILNPLWNTILSAVLGSLIGGFIAYRFNSHREVRNRTRKAKDEFLKTIAEWNGKISKNQFDLVALHAESITPINTGVYTLKPYLTVDEFHTLRSVLTEYEAIPQEKLDMIKSQVMQVAENMLKQPETPLAPDLLRDYFERFASAVR